METTPTTTIPLNVIERREWLNDNGGSGNTNFIVISQYRGHLESTQFRAGIQALARLHPLLQRSIRSTENGLEFVPVETGVPIQEYSWTDTRQWKPVAKKDIAGRFTKDYEPLWRVSFLKGEDKGQILLTFHHSIADGVCAMQIMHHLYQILASIKQGKEHTLIADQTVPDLANLYRLLPSDEVQEEQAPTAETVASMQIPRSATDWEMTVIDSALTDKILALCHQKEIRVYSVLFAALLTAIRRVRDPAFDTFKGLAVVNFRPYFDPPLSKDLVRALFSWILGDYQVTHKTDPLDLAMVVHRDLHSKLKAGDHIAELKMVEESLKNNPSPEEFLAVNQMEPNLVVSTNVGAVPFSGEYEELRMTDLFFAANFENYCQHKTNCNLGVVTFQNRMYLTLFFLEDAVPEENARQILEELVGTIRLMVEASPR